LVKTYLPGNVMEHPGIPGFSIFLKNIPPGTPWTGKFCYPGNGGGPYPEP